MWNRKEIKSNAKSNLKKCYWTMVAVCFILAVIVGRYGISTIAVYQYNNAPEYKTHVINTDSPITGWDYLNKIVSMREGKPLDAMMRHTPGERALRFAACAAVNAATQGYKYMLQFLIAFGKLTIEQDMQGCIALCFGGCIAILFYLFVGNILAIGEKRLFLESRLYPGTKILRIGFLYKNAYIWNATWVMMLRNIYQFLWNFTVIGGIIKSYEYRLIPYLLAENPKIEDKDAFRLAKNMMRGHKKKAFFMDLSFAGWMLLQPFTFGIIGLLYVNPYYTASIAELYMLLRAEMIDSQKDGYAFFDDPYLAKVPEKEEWAALNGYEI